DELDAVLVGAELLEVGPAAGSVRVHQLVPCDPQQVAPKPVAVVKPIGARQAARERVLDQVVHLPARALVAEEPIQRGEVPLEQPLSALAVTRAPRLEKFRIAGHSLPSVPGSD